MTEPAPAPAPVAPRTETLYAPDGSPVQVPLGDVASAVRSGKLGFAKDQTVHVADPASGGIVPMSGEQASAYYGTSASYGTSAAHRDDYAAQEEKKQFESLGSEVAATGLGAARGLTIGLSDAAITGLGGESARRYVQKAQKYNPGLSALGEGAGMVAPIFFTGGTSAGVSAGAKAGRLATAIPRGVMATGEAAGGLGSRAALALGAEEGGRLAGAARVLTQNAAEGALYGAGAAVSEASVRGEPLEIEKLLAGAGHGAGLGAVLGGTLHGGLALGKGAALKAGTAVKDGIVGAGTAVREKLVGKIASVLEGDAAALGARAEGGAARVADQAGIPGAGAAEGAIPGAAEGAIPGQETAKQKIRDFLGAASKGDVKAMESALDEAGTHAAARELGIATEGKGLREIQTAIADNRSVASLTTTSAKAQKNLDKLTADARALLPGMIEEDLRRVAGKSKHAQMPRAEMAEAAPLLTREAWREMDGVLGNLDDFAGKDASKLPSLTTSTERINREVIEPMLAEVRTTLPDGRVVWKDGGTRERIASDIRKHTEAHVGTTGYRDMHQTRKYFDEGVNFSATNPADVLKSKAMRSARDIMDGELVAAGDRAQSFAGSETALRWQAAKNKYAAAKTIQENVIIGATADAKNRAHGLSEQFGSAKGQALGTALGATLGTIVPVFGTAAGGLLGGLAGNMLGSQAASFSRRYGDQYVAKIAREASTDGVLRGLMTEVDKALDSKLGTYLGEKGIEAAAAAKNKLPGAKAVLEDTLGPSRAKKAGFPETAAEREAAGLTPEGFPMTAAEKAEARAAREARQDVRDGDASNVGARGSTAELAAAREVEQAEQAVERLQARAESAPPGEVRRALLDKLVAAKNRAKAVVEEARLTAAEYGAKAGRVVRAAPSTPALAVEADRVGKRARASREDEYQATRQRYADMVATPGILSTKTAAVRIARPDLADALDAKLTAIAQYVQSKAPPVLPGSSLLQPSVLQRPRTAPGAQAEWLKIVRAAERPLTVLEDLERGRLTTASIRTVKDLYPELHKAIGERVMDGLADRKEKLPYAKRVALGVLLDIPADASLTPAFLQASQASYAAGMVAPEAQQTQRGASSAQVKLSQSYSTKLDSLEAGATP